MVSMNYLDQISKLLANKKAGLDFESIINHLVELNQFKGDDLINFNDLRAELYSDMILDNRFFLHDDGKWSLRDTISLANLKKHYKESEVGNRSAMLNTAHFDDSQIDLSESKILLTSEIDGASKTMETKEIDDRFIDENA